jgi:predicted nucleic acid-binding protein
VLPITRAIADLWGELLAKSDKHIDDTGIVATARVHNLVLVTRNIKHVSGRGATLLDPYKSMPKLIQA